MIRLPHYVSLHSSHPRAVIALACLCMAGSVLAKLPPPTPEQAAAAQAVKDKAAADVAVEQAAVARVQDRIAAAYIQRQRENGIAVTPTPITPTATGANPAGATEVPAAALNSRPMEKSGAYNEAVTPSSAQGASSGSKAESAAAPQTK